LEINHRKILSFFSPIKKDFIFPDSGSQAQEDNPNVPDPQSGNLSKKNCFIITQLNMTFL